MAKGARRPKSLFLAGTQFLCFGEYLLYKGNNTYNINSCETIEVFYNIRIDLDKLNYASHITRIILDVTYENQNSYKILQLYLNTLYTISETEKDLELVVAVFKLRLLSILGFKPNINNCITCGTKENLEYFSFKDSTFKCGACGKLDKSSISISEGTQTAIRYIISADSKKLFSFNISEEIKTELVMLSNIYTNEKLEKNYKM